MDAYIHIFKKCVGTITTTRRMRVMWGGKGKNEVKELSIVSIILFFRKYGKMWHNVSV